MRHTFGGINMDQKRLIAQIIDESLNELENKCLEHRTSLDGLSGFRYWNYLIRNTHARRSILIENRLRDLIFKLDSRIGFAVHRQLTQRLASRSINFNRERPLHRNTRIWRQILVDYIRESGVSVRTKYLGHDGRWQSDTGLIRLTPYQTETHLFGSLLCAFSHQILHIRTGREKSRSIISTILHQNEALAFSYVVARALGLESEFLIQAIHSTFSRERLTAQSKQQIQDAASDVLTELIARYRQRSGIR